jgi:hypothetical protein
MAPNYANSKIYKLVDHTNGNIYFGSTTQTLYQRKAGHSSGYKCYLKGKTNYVTSFEIIKNGNYSIVLVENYECSDKSQLEFREAEYVRQNDCINKIIPRRTKQQYLLDNKDLIVEKRKLYIEKVKNWLREKTICECGGKFTYEHKAAHLKSKKHKEYSNKSA